MHGIDRKGGGSGTKKIAGAVLAVLLLWGVSYAQSYGPPTYSVGDTWTFKEGRSTREGKVVAVNANENTIKGLFSGCPTCLVRTDKNLTWLELLDAAGKPVDVTQYGAVPVGAWKLYDFPLEVNKTWNFSADAFIQNQPANFNYDLKVEAYEDVKTPAGVFKAYRIRAAVNVRGRGWENNYQNVSWFAPDAKIVVKFTTRRRGG